MSIEQCPICWTETSADLPVIPIDSHDDRHRFHEVCLFNWFQRNNTCPLCVEKVRRLNDPRQAPPANKAAAVAQGILVAEHPIITALRQNQPIDPLLLAEGNISPWVRKNGIRAAAFYGRQAALERLIQTDRERGIAIAFLIPNHTDLVNSIMDQAQDQNFVTIKAIIEAAEAGHQESLNHLCRNDTDRAAAIVYAISHPQIVQALFGQADDQDRVRRKAIEFAALNNFQPALETLIQTDIHRAMAISKAAPNHMELVNALFEQAADQECVRRNAIRYAAASNLLPALETLIETDSHRAIAIAHVAHAHVELTHALFEQANDREFTRRDAIVMAASFHKRETLAILIQSDEDRGIAMAYAVTRPDLVQTLLQQANDQEVAKKKAIEVTTLNGKLDALNVILGDAPKKSFFSRFFR